MKTIAIACLLTLACTTAAAAQTGLQLGVRGGAAITTWVGSDAAGSNSRTTVTFGGVLVWQPSLSPLGFETGLSFVSKGASDSQGGINVSAKVGYVEIPALLRLAMSLPGSDLRPVVNAGVVLGLKTSCTLEATSGGVTASVSCNDSSLGGAVDFKTFDLGLSGGLGVDVPVHARLILHPSVAYTRGLLSIDNTGSNSNVMNSAFFIGLELRLKL